MQVDKQWWVNAVNTAVCITKSVPCGAHPYKVPYEICFKEQQNLEYLQEFGTHSLAHFDISRRKKMDTKVRCMYVGTPIKQKDSEC